MPTRFPVRKLVSPRTWKVWLVVAGAYLLGAAILSAGASVPRWERLLGPGVAGLFVNAGGRIATLYGTLLLFASSQLAVLIWWARSRSPKDFAGQYRVWMWASAALFAAGCALITEAHQAWSETVLWLWRTDFRHHATLAWLTPVVLGGGMLFWSLLRETADSRGGAALLWLAAVGLLVAAVLSFAPMSSPDPALSALVQAAAVLFGYTSVFSALLLHARHVLYWSADPPASRPSRLVEILRRVRRPAWRFRLPGRKRPDKPAEMESGSSEVDAGGKKPVGAKSSNRSPKAEKKATPSRRSRRSSGQPIEADEPDAAAVEADSTTHQNADESSRSPARRDAEASPASDAEWNAGPSQQSASAERAQDSRESPNGRRQDSTLAEAPESSKDEADDDQTAGAQYRIDPPDKSMLKGLSKRERRKLQKAWRDQERATRRG